MKRSLSRRLLPFAYLLLIGLQMGCGGDDDGDDTDPMDAGAQDAGRDASLDAAADASVKVDAGSTYSAGQIVAILSAYNEAHLQVSPPALNTSVNPAVDAYINALLAERSAAKTRQAALVAALGLEPLSSPTSNMLSEQAKSAFIKVSAQNLMTVDRYFLDWHIQLLQGEQSNIDTMLYPAATSTQLRTEIELMRTAVAARLQEGRALRASLDDGGVSDAGVSDAGVSDAAVPIDGGE